MKSYVEEKVNILEKLKSNYTDAINCFFKMGNEFRQKYIDFRFDIENADKKLEMVFTKEHYGDNFFKNLLNTLPKCGMHTRESNASYYFYMTEGLVLIQNEINKTKKGTKEFKDDVINDEFNF